MADIGPEDFKHGGSYKITAYEGDVDYDITDVLVEDEGITAKYHLFFDDEEVFMGFWYFSQINSVQENYNG